MKKLKFDKQEIKKSLNRWFQFNFQTIGIYVTLLGTILYTTTMQTHIRTVYLLLSELSAFYMFMLMLLSTILIFIAVSYSKKRNPFGFFLFLFVTILNSFFAYKYVSIILNEVATRSDLVMRSFMRESILLTIVGAVSFVLATIYNGIIVDWKYVKIED